MQLFYCPGINADANYLDEEESRHCVKVLRKKSGDRLELTDGQGKIFKAEITDLSPKKCQFIVLSSRQIKKDPYFIHIAFAPTKNADRTAWFIEKAVEIGIDKITFIQTFHSERNSINIERAKKKAVSAMKQSLRAYLPEICGIEKIGKLYLEANSEDQKFIAHLDSTFPNHLKDLAEINKSYVALIGPEGGFSSEEILMAKNHGFQAVKIGDYRLRSETAGVVACSILNAINQR